MMNKKILLLALLLIPLTALSTLASIPEEINSFTINPYTSDINTNQVFQSEEVTVFDEYVVLWGAGDSGNVFNSRGIVRIYNYNTGLLVHEETFGETINCGVAQGENALTPMYFAGNLYLPWTVNCGTAQRLYVATLDVSNVAFISSDYSETGGTFTGISDQAYALDENLNEFSFLVGGSATYIVNATGGIEDVYSDFPFPINTVLQAEPDLENGVLVHGNDFYSFDYTNPSNATIIDAVTVGRGQIVDWDRNFLNPTYVTDEGHFVIVGGSSYDNVQTSTASIDEFTPLFIFETGNIIGLSNGTWIRANATDLGAITIENSTEEVIFSGDDLTRHNLNLITGLNDSSDSLGEFTIWNTSIPAFSSFLQEQVNTPPSIEADFLGVDVSGNFVFATTTSDEQGGLVYKAQSLYPASLGVDESFTVVESVNFASLATAETFDGLNPTTTASIQSPEYHNDSIFDNKIRLRPYVNDEFSIAFNDPVYSSETNTVTYQFIISPISIDELQIPSIDLEIGAESVSGAELFRYRFETDFFFTDEVIIQEYTGSYNTVFNGDRFDEGGQKDFYSLTAIIDFDNQSSYIIIQGVNETFYNATVPFLESATSLAGTKVNLLDGTLSGDYVYHLGAMTYEYTTTIADTINYEVIDLFEPNQTIVEPTLARGPHTFGSYAYYSYVTDEDLGLSYIDTFDVETFVYDEETPILTSDEINNLIRDVTVSAGVDADEGFRTVARIEGDLVTDTLFGYLDLFNVKSSASKFLVGLVVLFIFLSIGVTTGGQTKSEMGTTIGGLIGGVGGLFLVTYVGLFPAWVTFVVALVTFAVVAGMVRNTLVGRR